MKSFLALSIASVLSVLSASSALVLRAAEPVFPVKVSPDGRYFVDQSGAPVFWLGTTQWQLFRDNTPEEARTVIDRVKANNFTFIQVMLAGVGDGTRPNVAGEKPWVNDDPLTPNEPYFRQVDAAVDCARRNGVTISMTIYHQRWRKLITRENARPWGKWVAGRYRDVPTIVWSMTPEAKDEFVPVLRELAAGLREGDGGAHLITFKPDPAPYSSSFIHGEAWLDFDSMQVWKSLDLIHPFVTRDYAMKPVKPVLMAEGAYEAGTEYGFEVTPLWVRRQAYSSYLSGAHFTYGHNDSWRVLPTWKKALDAPGAVQMGILKKAFLGLKEWWKLTPDQSVLERGGNTSGNMPTLAARHAGGAWAIAYLSAPSTVSIRLDKVTGGRAEAAWIDPRTGDRKAASGSPAAGVGEFTTPAGWEDALLVIESRG